MLPTFRDVTAGRLATLLVAMPILAACAAPRSPAGIGPVPAGMHVRANEVFYDVQGSTAAELWASLRANGPQIESRRVFGQNVWNIRWTFQYAPSAAQCRMRDARVELVSTTRLPRWTPPPDAPRELVDQWNAFLQALTEHERGHQANGAAAAREIVHAFRSFRAPACEMMHAEATRVADRIFARYRELDRTYDQTTGQGRTQGAVWPPTAGPTELAGEEQDSGKGGPSDPRR